MNALRLMMSLAIVSALHLPSLAHASLQQELDGMFGDMTNYTSPGTYETQRRGVISGGSFVNRSRIMQENLIGFVPPSASASCAGVDLYGGSFSFINTDQLVQLLRSIAANARGYAFQLALSAMCEKCMQNIETLQKKIQQFNQYFSNSCQLAKGLVTDARDSFRNQAITSQAMTAHFKGFGDLFASWSQDDGMTPEQKANQVARDDVVKNVEGNLVWRALKRHNAAAWFANGDDNLLEAIMSITGTIVVGELYEDAGAGGWTRQTTVVPSRKITMRDIIHGNTNATIYRCNTYDADGCTQLFDASGNPILQTVAIAGIKQRLETTLLGDDANPGIVAKFARNVGDTTASERALLAALPEGMGGMIRTLAIKSEPVATFWVRDSIDYISLDMAYTLLNSFVQAVETAGKLNAHAETKELQKMLGEVRDVLGKEYEALQRDKGPRKRMIETYNAYLKAYEHRTYTMSRKSRPTL